MQRFALFLLLLTLVVSLINCDNHCGKSMKLRPGFITKYDYNINFRRLEEPTELLNVTAEMLFRSNAETGRPEVVFPNGKMNYNDAAPDNLKYMKEVIRYQKFSIHCATSNDIEFSFVPDKGELIEIPIEFLTMKWMIALIDTEVTTGLQSNVQNLSKKLNLRIAGPSLVVGSVDFEFNYNNPEGYEVKMSSVDFSTIEGFFKNAPLEMSLWFIVDRDDLTVRRQGGTVKIPTENVTMDVSSRFIDNFPEANYKRAFEDRSIPDEVNTSASSELVQLIQPKSGFDARWKLVVDRFSFNVGNQTLVNKPIVADVILRSIDDPRYVLAKFIMSPDNSAGHGSSNLSEVGILSFSKRRTLIFDFLGDNKLPYVFPLDMVTPFLYLRIFHEKVLKFVNDATIKDDLSSRLETRTYRQRCARINCDIVHEVGGNEDVLRIQAMVLKKDCSSKNRSYELDMVQIFGRSDQKLKNLSLHIHQVVYEMVRQLNAEFMFIGYEPKRGNDDQFTVYGEVVNQEWFN